MDQAALGSNIRKIVGQRNIFIALSVVMAVSSVCLSLLLFSKSERVVIVPTNGASFWIEKDQVSDKYLEHMGTYLADLILNRSPADAEWRNQEILKHVHPKHYHELQRLLIRDAKDISMDQKSVVFRPELSYADAKKSAFIIEGAGEVFVGKADERLTYAQSTKKRYTLRFKCESGRLSLTSITQETLQ